MNRFKYILLLLVLPVLTFAQESKLSVFDNLVGKTWIANGSWGNGAEFKQEIEFNFDLEGTIVTAKSKGFVDQKQTKLGSRNLGIRKFDAESKQIKFWEFDVFGGVTEGIVILDGDNILYQYDYGGTLVTDMWEYVNDSEYNFKVGSYINGKWEQIFLNTKFVLKQ